MVQINHSAKKNKNRSSGSVSRISFDSNSFEENSEDFVYRIFSIIHFNNFCLAFGSCKFVFIGVSFVCAFLNGIVKHNSLKLSVTTQKNLKCLPISAPKPLRSFESKL